MNTPANKLTKAQVRALAAVRDGTVTNVFHPTGNKFEGPEGIGGQCYRHLQELRLIEDVPGHKTGAYTTRVTQQITFAGRTALAEHGQ